MRTIMAACALTLALAAAAAAGHAKLMLYNVHLDWDPNGNIWHLTSKVCNKDQGDSGTLLYELRLYEGDPVKGAIYHAIGGKKYQPLHANQCHNLNASEFKVYTKKVRPGEYKIVLFVGDWDGSSYNGRIRHVFDHTFIRGN